MIQHFFRLDGQPIGFVYAGALFDYHCHYLGWLERDNSVWTPDGSYLGEFVDSTYILRDASKPPRLPRSARLAPLPPPPALPPSNKAAAPARDANLVDAL